MAGVRTTEVAATAAPLADASPSRAAGAAPGAVAILGATSGIARGVAGAYAAKGYDVIAAGRDADECRYIAADIRTRYGVDAEAVALDALDFASHAGFPGRCEQAIGAKVDTVVVCFATMAEQTEAQRTFDVARQMVDTNVTAPISMLEPFAALFEARGNGCIVGVSSVAGDRGRGSNYLYGATKAAFSTYLQGLRNRLYKSGVHVMTVKPGFVDTKMTYGLGLPGLLVASPDAVGRAICRAATRHRDIVYVPFFWRYIMVLIRLIPEFQFKRMGL